MGALSTRRPSRPVSCDTTGPTGRLAPLGVACRFSDVLSRREFHRLDLYAEICRPLGINHVMKLFFAVEEIGSDFGYVVLDKIGGRSANATELCSTFSPRTSLSSGGVRPTPRAVSPTETQVSPPYQYFPSALRPLARADVPRVAAVLLSPAVESSTVHVCRDQHDARHRPVQRGAGGRQVLTTTLCDEIAAQVGRGPVRSTDAFSRCRCRARAARRSATSSDPSTRCGGR